MSVISIKNLSKSYKKQNVLDDISLHIESPGIWALVGPNGVGKTTFLNVLTNLIPLDSGTISLVGMKHSNFKVFKQVSYLQDNSVLYHYLTGYEHLKFICDMHNLSKQRLLEVVDYVGMGDYLHKLVGNYSLGMKQHLLLALSIINKPTLLLLDEPLNGLDPSSAILMRRLLLELAADGTTIILSSHNLSEIDRVTNQIIFLKDGKITEVHTKDHELTYYHLQVADQKKATDLLTENHYEFSESESCITFRATKNTLNEYISLITKYRIMIQDIQKETTSTEDLYNDFFRREVTK
ncbi:ABC transporter ATP-binding protein [Alkalicoccobacillus plakortidis]|uniref:ABC transporter ATP-binding protein n=1 Tax=Alkalicoccobacillus plakortidis TaxID=444060 RepID=A0ABT0XN45_9BACI|nr:ABC transporter ATP-binding protein [Alkalicoccobacillus plakortidis]MCM2677329.1 ABC transporter ATP-binding protein [Alkalicoccobacillus plakortidis]